jgi:uncharacterized protein YndB with AHSA1/START domain
MTEELRTDPIVHERQIDASPETVFMFFTDPEKLTRWLAAEATLDPRPGGVCQQIHIGTDGRRHLMRGEFVEVSYPERVVFTWGFENDDSDLPPGTSTVEVTFEPRDGGTWLRLEHRDLTQAERPGHDTGWVSMLGRLADAVAAART